MNPLMVVLAVSALGLAGVRFVSLFEPEGSDPVSPAAHAATPVTPAVIDGTDRSPNDDSADDARAWAAAFGQYDATAPEPEPEPADVSEPEPEPEPEKEPEPQDSTQYWLTGLIRGDGRNIALVHDGTEEQVASVGSRLSGGETVMELGEKSILIRRDDDIERIVFRD